MKQNSEGFDSMIPNSKNAKPFCTKPTSEHQFDRVTVDKFSAPMND